MIALSTSAALLCRSLPSSFGRLSRSPCGSALVAAASAGGSQASCSFGKAATADAVWISNIFCRGFASSAASSCLRQQGKTLATATATSAPVSSAAAFLAPAARRGLSQGLRGASTADLAKAQGISLAAGTAAGAFGSVVGVGGGVLIVPMIAGACRSIPQRIISGTSLAAVVSTGVFSTFTYSSTSHVDLGAAACICLTAMLMAPAGARMTAVLDSHALKRILGYFLVGVSPLIPLKTFLVQQKVVEERHPDAELHWPSNGRAAMLLAVGAVAGLLSGLLGIGGGVVVTPLLALTSGMSQADCVGTSLCAMIPPAAAGLLQHHAMGNVNWRMAAALALGTAVGGTAGSRMALEAPEGAMEFCFSAAMLFLGYRMLRHR